MQGGIWLPVSPIHLMECTDEELEEARKLLEPLLADKE